MTVDYNPFAKSFSKSRKNMSWPEIEYFFSFLEWDISLLDIGCGSGRLLSQYQVFFDETPSTYLWVDLSEGLLSEAKKQHPKNNFLVADMWNIKKAVWNNSYTDIFLIASFHHLDSIEKRTDTLWQIYDILYDWWRVYMTNWALNSELNREKYMNSIIADSQNIFGSQDYEIKIWKYKRFYHSFSLEELSDLGKKTGFKILENRVFENDKNIITILQK